MKTFSFSSAPLDLLGVCLIVALDAACSFDASQLRPLADGAVEHPAVPDVGAAGGGNTTISPDALFSTGGSGGSTGVGGSGGVGVDAGSTVAGGTTNLGDAAVPPDLANARDVPPLVETIPTPDAAMDAPLAVDATSIPDTAAIPDVPEVPDVAALPDEPQVPDVSANLDATPDGIPGPCGPLIDNMEDGTGNICKGNGRVGYWFSYADSASVILPNPVLPSLLSPPRGSSQRAMHTYGTCVQQVGIGCFLNFGGVTASTYNATGYTGIQFYAMGTAGALKLVVQTPASESTTYGGQCTLAVLSCTANSAQVLGLSANQWNLIMIPFSSLSGGIAPFNVTELWSIEFQPGSGAFDFWIDDLSFY
jgi:hypothetical protein